MNFKNLSWKKLDIVLEYRNPPLVCWLHVYRQRRKELEIGHFATFRPLWPWPWIRSYDLPVSTSNYIAIFVQIRKKLLVDGLRGVNLQMHCTQNQHYISLHRHVDYSPRHHRFKTKLKWQSTKVILRVQVQAWRTTAIHSKNLIFHYHKISRFCS